VQVFRIQDNVAEVEVNPGLEAFWNNRARKAFRGSSSSRENIANPNMIYFVWQSFDKFLIRTWGRIKASIQVQF